ncbi:S-layer homology domain-containing protein [Paenibacillus mesophilus]|uniref:S-layer homology domain-containing protein n=1 Tax=Paenibacillus mesophilus TaxID=2582849 RepID=UPI00130519B3|nr:S-layer homology domain-containing protein [Paenibacillus mesophilus]
MGGGSAGGEGGSAGGGSSPVGPGVSIGYNLTRWILDEPNGYIYAVSKDANKLLFIRTSDLQVEREINIGSKPSDLDLYDGKLYVAISGGTLIKVVDLAQKSVTREIATSVSPDRLVVEGQKLYYAPSNSWSVYQMQLSTGQDAVVPGMNHYYAAFALDRSNHILYVGDSGTSGSKVKAYRTDTNALLDKDNYNDGYGFSYSNREVIVYGSDLFYASHKLNKSKLSDLQGRYQETEPGYSANIVAVTNKYVISDRMVFDRETFTPITAHPFTSNLMLMDSSDAIYGFNYDTKTIHKIRPDLTQKSPISYSKSGNDTIVFDRPLTNWAASPNGKYLYAISQSSNRLIYIRTEDWVVEKDIHIGSAPTDLSVVNGQVYVALSGSSFIGVLDTVYGTAVTDSVYRYGLNSSPYKIDGGNGKLFYTDLGSNLRVVDAVYSQGKKLSELNNQLYASPTNILVDQDSHTLYVHHYNGVNKINTDTYAIIYQSNSSSNSSTNFHKDGDYLYRGNQRLSASVAGTVYGSYGTDGSYGIGNDIIYAKGNYVFTGNALYDRDSFNKITDLPDLAAKAYVDDAGHVYLYYANLKKTVKYNSVDSLIQQNPANQVPAYTVRNLYFNDTDTTRGSIGGSLSWLYPENTKYITSYVVYFLDAQRNKMGDPLGTADKNKSYYQIPQGTRVPDGAKYLGVFSKNPVGESRTSASIEIVENAYPTVNSMAVAVRDKDPRRGFIDATFQWIPSYYGQGSVTVQLYFADKDRNPLGEIVKESPFGKNGELQNVDMGAAPSGAKYVMAKYKFSDGTYDTQVHYAPFVENISAEPVSDAVGKPGAPAGYNIGMTFYDQDQQEGRLGGQLIHFYSGPDSVTDYVLYYLNKDNERIQPIMEVPQPSYDPNNYYYGIFMESSVIPAGAVKLGLFPKNASGEGAYGAIRTIWDFPYAQPSQVQFTDANPLRGISGAKLTWAPDMQEKSPLKEYVVQYLDRYASPVGEPVAVVAPGQDRYEVTIPDHTIPADAFVISIMMKDIFGERFPVEMRLIAVPISDNISGEKEMHFPYDPNLATPAGLGYSGDEDGDKDELASAISWAFNSKLVTGYNLYFMDAQGNKLKPIVSVKGFPNSLSSAQIPFDTVIPEGSKEIGIFAWDGSKEGGLIKVPVVDNTYSPSLAAEQIQVINNGQGTNDTITVTGLRSGDQIKVYRNNTIAYPIASKVSEGASVTFNIPQLGKEAGSIFVTLKASTYLESRRVQKTYSAEQSTTGTVGSGCCAMGGAPATPSQPSAPGTYTPETKNETSNGKTYAVAELDASKLADAFKQAGQQNTKVVIDMKDAQNAKVQIPADALLNAAANGSSGNGVISIKSNNVSYDLPIGLFDIQTIARQLGIDPKDVKITVTMEQVSGASAQQITSQAQRDGVTLLTAPVEFTITIGSGSNQQGMNDFGGTYVTRTFVLTSTVDGSTATAVRIDPVTGEMYFVPAIFSTANGQTEVKMMRQGNSIYSVVETKLRTFTDIQGHWAKADIELLTAKLIVKGADADRFMPDQSITRAEFAALLVRSLGISEEKTNRTPFEDIPSGSWFAGSVAAAASKGLVDGVDDKNFSPNESITREQMALMIARALTMTGKKEAGADQASSPLSRFADRDKVSSWAQEAVSRVLQANLMNGTATDTFAPSDKASRAQVAVILKRMLQHVGFIN